jgi:hypothetical protein
VILDAKVMVLMDYAASVARIFNHLENDHVESAVMACLRIARAAQDHFSAALFLRELYPNKEEVARALVDETQHLNKEAKKFLYERSLERWLSLHTIDGIDDDDDKDEGERANVLMVAVGEIEAEIERWQGTLKDLTVPPGMSAFDTAAFAAALPAQRATIRARIAGLHTVKARLKSRCLNYAISIEHELDAANKNEHFLHGVQNEVHSYFKGRADDVVQKLVKASQLASSADSEDSALLLTEVRRVLKASADLFWPVKTEEPVKCADGQTRRLGDQQHLNRLQEFIRVRLRNSTTRDLLAIELDHLEVFFRRLNDLGSKGVHAEVTHAEARQGLVGVYFFLSNLIRHLTAAVPEPSET